jgi:hypothetical protein
MYSESSSTLSGDPDNLFHDNMKCLLGSAFIAFTNIPDRAHEAFHLLSQLSEYASFSNAFADTDGLNWLYSLSFPLSSDCSLCGDIRSPSLALLRLFNTAEGFKHLKKKQTRKLLDSTLIFNGDYQAEDAPNIILLTECLFEHLKGLGHEGVYHKAAVAFETILDQERTMINAPPRERYEVGQNAFGTRDFSTWETSITTTINELKGLIPPIKKEPGSPFLSHISTSAWIVANSGHVGQLSSTTQQQFALNTATDVQSPANL